ncbi:hypothetical protein [Moorena sp. SIO4G3]|uniref:hypothetical protein n=1 Tax=Moorena sp. SIO4G3 TaxID=2607821 RepID=UPI00142B260D|nr:hypothetical protein [Moorena sp. SIO4G3]NEO75226.1 hypothetical protein [Moorena sp. SIO4G3]
MFCIAVEVKVKSKHSDISRWPWPLGHDATVMATLRSWLSYLRCFVANLCYGKMMGFSPDFKFDIISNY